ncbi:MAG TPA: aminotransferase class V-fold PLP-dependent enzyme [Pyrinomonadaceae bacterium]|nr:aminotransferase class V-fold PLP-dependent enzyme [Pyrinomonadaceae bacterium]HMP66963.1 aminotransferase class V-fold PLP-dependent enzyme [Pyrinomonadaceae bacterium]
MNSEIRSLFPALDTFAYLNSAAVSPPPQPAVDAVISQLRDVSSNGSENYPLWVEKKDRARKLVSEMLNVRPENIAFMRNTSDGIASVAAGLVWNAGDNIVSFEKEFPANYYAWRQVRDRFGVELRLCPEREGRIDLDEFIGMIDSKTRVVAISAVQYASGFRTDLERLGRAARSVGALFVVDIIQGLGAMGFDLPAQYVDVAAGASHKWLCAPEGCGIVYVSDRARNMLEPAFVGWISVETPWDFADLEQPFRPNALAWESGTGPSSLFYGLEASLNIISEVGLAKIDKYLLGLSDQVCDASRRKGYTIVSSRVPGEASAIVSIKSARGVDAADLYRDLRDVGVIVSARGDRLRISPHFFNIESDIERFVEALPE